MHTLSPADPIALSPSLVIQPAYLSSAIILRTQGSKFRPISSRTASGASRISANIARRCCVIKPASSAVALRVVNMGRV